MEMSPGAGPRLPQALLDFAGTWKFSRKIHDRLSHQVISVDGTARLEPDAEGLGYSEESVMHLADHAPMHGTRRYLWRHDGAEVAVYFADGAPFHRFALGQATPEAAHWCDPDSYAVTYDFADWPVWRTTWTVTGPRKDYLMETLLARAG
ncbi:DUF6314 family protein [Litorisediminicola beolgyonensis]|uniref:DUF6314 family protein n=1 Tax=Litorisediminicola beolgyonensis TaxID=1173614 RepID=A0ABW3ZGC8_9RHOB